MSCTYAKQTDEYHGWRCEVTNGECMYLIPNSKACARDYGKEPDTKFYERKNSVNLIGRVSSPCVFSHKAFKKNFYILKIEVKRLSGQVDEIPLMVSETILNIQNDYRGQIIQVEGEFHSYNFHEGEKNHLLLSVLVKRYFFIKKLKETTKTNEIVLYGFICKTPVYRRTPLGREITDFFVAVHRLDGRSDYIPCIAWGRNARYMKELKVGSQVHICGRIQSREYIKNINEKENEKRMVYEVSVVEIGLY